MFVYQGQSLFKSNQQWPGDSSGGGCAKSSQKNFCQKLDILSGTVIIAVVDWGAFEFTGHSAVAVALILV
jgi:hypothetical protein